ncbi:AAA family ATPase [Bacillus thuringiensis]|uniref:AAA family ATPase n=1 Tax=Bacillus thuringiensis TaxID=1428 RepID=UPI0011A3CC95|nr:AAA family ATPase [Bacillus thuringiensis]
MNKILLATGHESIDNATRKLQDYEFVGSIEYKKDLLEACSYYKPDIVLVSDFLTGKESLLEEMVMVRQNHPQIRIVYVTKTLDMKNKERVNQLGMLVLSGIYDILTESKLSIQLIKNLLDNPRKKENVDYLLRNIRSTQADDVEEIQIETPDEEEVYDVEKYGYKNVYLVSSIKPGTGKSFASTNLATTIAKYGKKKDGKAPKVGLIEADLQNLSVGTLLQIEDDKHNLKTVMEKIATIMTSDGRLIEDASRIEEVNRYIKSCFKSYYHCKNLEALVGSQLTMEEIENIQPFHYIYLIEAIVDDYDVIIIDTNSSLAHVTTYPLLRLSNTAYYIINLDFNNVRNNARYKETLRDLEVLDRVKYILNEDIEDNGLSNDTEGEKLIFTSEHLSQSGFDVDVKIPLLPKNIFLNRLYEGTPVVLDNKPNTLKARLEFAKMANQIWEMENLPFLEQEYKSVDKKKEKKGRF